MTLHKICVGISALAGLPVALLGLLLVVPAGLERSPAVVLLLSPAVLVVWAIVLFVRLVHPRSPQPSLRWRLLAFYVVAGALTGWATTWDFSRDGTQGPMFSPWTTVAAVLFFAVPLAHLLLSPRSGRPITEPSASPNGGPATGLGNSAVSEVPPSVS